MKDDKLQNEFEEYFKGVNISDEIVADAKKSVERKRSKMPKVVKFLSIAASIVLVFAVSLAVILKTDFDKVSDGSSGDAVGDSDTPPSDNDGDNDGDNDEDNDGDDDEDNDSSSPEFPDHSVVYYTDADLEKQTISTDSLSALDPSLKFIEENSSGNSCTAGYMDEELALIIAEIGLENDKTSVFVEFTGKKLIYNELSDYYNGDKNYYNEVLYYLTQTTKQGVTESKLLVLYGGVKYYFGIASSDKDAYDKYLKLIVK